MSDKITFVTLDHKTSHKVIFFFPLMYGLWFRIGQYLTEIHYLKIWNLRVQKKYFKQIYILRKSPLKLSKLSSLAMHITNQN